MSELPATVRRTLELSLAPAGSAFHTAQVSISFGEAVDATALRAAWEAVAGANPALRAVFENEDIRELPAPAFAWREFDWQADAPADLGAAWQALFDADGATPVTTEAQRFTLIRLPNGHGHALWTFHAVLLDEGSVSDALHRWLIAYDHLRTGADLPPLAAAVPGPTPSPAEEIPAPPPLLLLPAPEESAAATRRALSHTYERPERAAFVVSHPDLRALALAAWSLVIARALDADHVHLLETTRPESGLGRLEDFAFRRREISAHATAADLIRASAAEVPALHATAVDVRARIAFLYRPHTLNDRLHLELPRWMAADAQLFAKTAAPLALRFVASDRPVVSLEYDPAVVSDAAARALFTAFRGALEAFAAEPTLVLADFTLPGAPAVFPAAETAPVFRSLVTQGLHEMFADAAEETPDHVAVETAEETLTFAQLNALANQIARLLRRRQVAAGARVALAAGRSPRWVAALLGILKAGAVVTLPHPDAKIDARIDAWIVDALPEGDDRKEPILQLATDATALAAEKSRGVPSETSPESPALAWRADGEDHTFDHATLARSLESLAALLELSPADRVLQFAPPSEAAAVEETLAALLSGATVVLRPNDPWGTRTAFQEFLQGKTITVATVPTAFWTQWTHYLAELSLTAPATLRLAVTTGAPPAPPAAAAWPDVGGDARWLHRTTSVRAGGLGLTLEPAGDFAPDRLGRPAPLTVARVTDRHGLLQPVGFPGRLEIAPAAAPDRFRALDLTVLSAPEATFSDLATRRLSLGAPDRAASAAGIRLAAVAHPRIFDAHVESRLIAARQEWCLWIVPRDSESGEPPDFREWLAARLGFAPRRVRALPRFPLDPAGRLDAAALGELLPEDVAAPAPAQRSGTPEEEKLREALSRALGGRRVDLDEILAEGRAKPAVARRLFEAATRVEPRVELADFTTGFSVRSLLRNIRARQSSADARWTPLQPLRASGKQPPLVFLHDLEGDTRLYAPLVAGLGDDQPCYGLHARELADPAAAPTVESLAAAYAEALRVFDARGSYRLVGYGFGGLLAFELARQLTAAGAEVPLLVLLATEPPVGAATPAGLLAGGWKRALPALFGRKPAAAPRRGGDTPLASAHREAARRYSAHSVALTAHIFVPEVDFPAYPAVHAGWSACCADPRFYQVPCSGPDMLAEPAAEDLAHFLGKLTRAEPLEDDSEAEEN